MRHQFKRAKYSAAEKVKILQEGEFGNRPIVSVCEKYRIASTTYYRWQKEYNYHLHPVQKNPPKDNLQEIVSAAVMAALSKIVEQGRIAAMSMA